MKLIIEGENLTTIKNVVRAIGNYRITEELSSNENHETLNKKPVIEGTCSACPYFNDIGGVRGDRVKWGKCTRYGDVAVNREKKICKSYEEEVKVECVIA